MSEIAESAALKAYPIKDYNKESNYIHTCDSKMLDEVYRDVFRIGYSQAEKDLALGWEDIKKIDNIVGEMIDSVPGKMPELLKSEAVFYGEVLRRFNEYKQGKNETV